MSKAIQPRLGTVVTMIVAVLFLFLLFSQAGKYHQSGFIVKKAEERLALNQERKKAMLYIGVSDDVALKIKPIEIPLNNKEVQSKPVLTSIQSTSQINPNASTSAVSTKESKTKTRRIAKYTVKRGDTLFGIAQKIYGDGNKWRIILKKNTQLTKPSNLKMGMKLTIPEPTQSNSAYIKWIKSSKSKS